MLFYYIRLCPAGRGGEGAAPEPVCARGAIVYSSSSYSYNNNSNDSNDSNNMLVIICLF